MSKDERCHDDPRRKPRTLGRLVRDRRGAAIPEYALLLVVFGIPVATGMYAAGKKLVESYGHVRDHVLSSVP
jgi:Flp pilus assembly pilin Flp